MATRQALIAQILKILNKAPTGQTINGEKASYAGKALDSTLQKYFEYDVISYTDVGQMPVEDEQLISVLAAKSAMNYFSISSERLSKVLLMAEDAERHLYANRQPKIDLEPRQFF